jgi:hypothetical protein
MLLLNVGIFIFVVFGDFETRIKIAINAFTGFNVILGICASTLKACIAFYALISLLFTIMCIVVATANFSDNCESFYCNDWIGPTSIALAVLYFVQIYCAFKLRKISYEKG